MLRSIRSRLNVLFVVVTTATLATFAAYGHFQLARELDARFAAQQRETLERLTISLQRPLWDLDRDGVRHIMLGELAPAEVLAIRVLRGGGAADQIFVGLEKGESGLVEDGTDEPKGLRREAPISAHGSAWRGGPKEVGTLVVWFSRAHIEASLSSNLWRRLAEILVVDLVLLLALSRSLNMVFRPLATLREALDDLAMHENEDAEELPERQNDEFGEVIRAFNRTQRKLKSVLARRRRAEEAARGAADETERAYEELKSAQTSLVEAEKLASLGGLVAGVAHEINTPVGITLTSASVLRESTLQVRAAMTAGAVRKSEMLAYLDTAEESTRLILANAERAAHLIQSFKQVAVDQTSEARREFELGDYINEVVASLWPKFKHTRIKVEVRCPEPIAIDGYPGAMAQVLTNLAMNALTHAYEDGQSGCVLVEVARDQQQAVIHFSDDGKGIAAEHLGHIFDPFFTTKRGAGGTGLGLNILHSIVTQRFGGSIAVASAPGRGTRFTIKIPVVSPHGAS